MPDCQLNHPGSSKSLETAATILMFNRSVEKFQFRNTVLLNDGDSSVFKSLQDINDNTGPYGHEYQLKNEDCVNHLSKRMKNSLDSVISKMKTQGHAIAGKERLTKDRVRALQNNYGRAIKYNSDNLDAIYNATWATFLHYIIDDETPRHNNCPPGPTSWCWYNRQLAEGITKPVRLTNSAPLSKEICEAILPIYQCLCDKEILKRCLRGATQNVIECLNQMIWKKAPQNTGLAILRV
ncbi:hypothetical protein SNE40_008534 [Patella caerulea]|uniref:Mutator-like transposase domain-containing protein n=1 Tax=Patella caerulea TaxID=87958 RepID=A0AAN8Q3S7_PATCE